MAQGVRFELLMKHKAKIDECCMTIYYTECNKLFKALLVHLRSEVNKVERG